MSKTFIFDRFDIYKYDSNEKVPAADGEYVMADDAINREAVLQAQIRTLESQLAATKRAALAGMDAAKSVSSIQLQEAARLRAESSPEALASERAANEILTAENARLSEQLKDAQTLLKYLDGRASKRPQGGGWVGYYDLCGVPAWDDVPASRFKHNTFIEAIKAEMAKEKNKP